MTDIASTQMQYNESVSHLLADYYTSANSKVRKEFKRFLISHSIVEQLDDIFNKLETFIEKSKLRESKSLFSNKLMLLAKQLSGANTDIKATIFNNVVVYKNQKIHFDIKRRTFDICKLCGSKMVIHSSLSELRCASPECRQVVTLYGVVFDDAQLYNQQNVCTKTKKYDPTKHCVKWISKIQANECFTFPNDVIEKIDSLAVREYMRRGELRPMTNLSCAKIREWLQNCKFTGCYDHAPLLRRIITGLHGKPIIPPQLTPLEQQHILIEYSCCMQEFAKVVKDPEILRKIDKVTVKNKFYYPDILYRLLKLMLKRTDRRRKKLLETINLQGDDAITRNNIIWNAISIRRGYKNHIKINPNAVG